MLRIEGLCKSYKEVQALRGVDLSIRPGEICALVGPNGAGKTTLVSIVAGLRRADSGSVAVAGVDALKSPADARRLLGVAPQDLGIYPTVSPRENLMLFGELAGLRGSALDERIEKTADVLDLTEFMDRKTRDLSGGEKRRVHTAMAILHLPPLLLLDEPTAGVDVSTRQRLLQAVRDLAYNDGTAVCYSTHYLPEVEALGASVAIIDGGRIIARGAADELVASRKETAIELRFDGPVPSISFDGRRVDATDDTVRIYTEDPASDSAAILANLGASASRLRSVEIVTPSLENVFLSLTGRRYAEESTEDANDVLAS